MLDNFFLLLLSFDNLFFNHYILSEANCSTWLSADDNENVNFSKETDSYNTLSIMLGYKISVLNPMLFFNQMFVISLLRYDV